MKSLKKISVAIVFVLFVCIAILSGCGGSPIVLPNKNDPVIGNGGLTVQKGDYLYFVNGYYSKSNLSTTSIDDNDFGNVLNGSICRTKLGNNGKIEKDEKGFLTNVEVIVPKLVGFEQGGFYIFGDKLYYLTPVNKTDKSGTVKNELTEISKINLDGTKQEIVYETENEVNASNIQFSYVNGEVHIAVLDGTNLVYINGNTKKSVKVAENVTSFAMGQKEAYYDSTLAKNVDEFANNIYYTRNASEDETSNLTGNVVASYNITSKEETILNFDNNTFAIVDCKNGSLYYNKTDSVVGSTYLAKMPLNKTFDVTNEIKLLYASYTTVYIADFDSNATNENFVITSDGSKLKVHYIENGKFSQSKEIANGTITILSVRGGQIYYLNGDSTNLYIANIKPNANGEYEISSYSFEGKTLKTDMAVNFDTDGRNMYFYVEYTSESGTQCYYLNRLDTLSLQQNAEFMGKLTEEHMPAEPEEEGDLWIE